MSEEKTKKKRVNSKAKGSGFENQVGKTLSETLAPMKFRRSQSSGAILGGVNQRFLQAFSDEARALFVGDVVPTNETDVLKDEGWKLRFSLECKFYKDADNVNHLFNNTKILGWFNQAETDAAKVNKEPLLIFKFNHTDIFCAIDGGLTELPRNVSKVLTLEYNVPGSNTRKMISMVLFKEALADPEWFKVRPDSEDDALKMYTAQKQMQQNNPNPV